MDAVYYYIAIACFAVAVICAVAAVIIFFRAGVPDAVRFLRHKPMKGASGSKPRTTLSRSGRLRAAKKVSAGPAAISGMDSTNSDLIAPPDDRTTTSRGKHAHGKTRRVTGKKPSIEVPAVPSVSPVADGSADASSSADQAVPVAGQTPSRADQAASRGAKVETSEDPTDILSGSAADALESYEEETSEDPTGLLTGDEETESPTGMLAEEDSENPTGLLDDGEASENPTGMLMDEEETENPTGMLMDEAESENPTGMLMDEGETEAPTGMLVGEGETEDPTGMLVEQEGSEAPTGILGSEPKAAADPEPAAAAAAAAEPGAAATEPEPAATEPTAAAELEPEPVAAAEPAAAADTADELPVEASAADEASADHEDPDSPTRMLTPVPVEDENSPDEDDDGVAQLEEDEFRFIIKQNIIVVHTDEVIEG